MANQERNQKTSKAEVVRSMSLIISVFATMLTMVAVYIAKRQSITPIITPSSDLSTNQADIKDIKNGMVNLTSRIENIEQLVDEISQIPSEIATNFEIIEIRNELDSVSADLQNIEEIIIEDPEKALSLVLLKNEMESIKQNYETALQNVRGEIGRVYSQNNWFIGLLFTMALGLLTLAISNFLPKREKKESEED